MAVRRCDSGGWRFPGRPLRATSVCMIDVLAIRQRWEADGSKRDERGRRLFAASEARAAGWGGLAAVSSVTGLARSTIGRGLKDLDAPPLAPGRVRREGGGPRSLTETDLTLLDDLKRLVEPATLGDPVRPLLWVSKSLDKLASALVAMGHSISPNSVRKLLVELGFSRQVNRKSDEGSGHPGRNAQFEYINAEVLAAQAAGQPVISVDTKKKELVGNFRNGGSDWRPKGDPQRVKVHDFEDKKLGKVAPYGVYDIAADAGWVSLGITCDTAEFAVASIRAWLERIGWGRYPDARDLTITADCGGSNGSRVRLWKVELQKLADETGLTIKVRHDPPGTSKWNKIGVSRTHPQRKEVWSCTRDEGSPLAVGSQVQTANRCKLRTSRAVVVNVAEKAGPDPVRYGPERRAKANR